MPTIICDGVTVNYHDVGRGDPVILIHCSSSSHRQWRALWELLQGEYRVIAIDMLDWGETGAWSKKSQNLLHDEAEIIQEVAEDLGERIHLVGHSYGGTICYYFALTAPKKIKSLTLIEPMLGWLLESKQDTEYYQELFAVADNFLRMCSSGKPEVGIQNYFDYWNGEGAWEKLDKVVSNNILAGAEKLYCEFESIFEGGRELPDPEFFPHPTLLIGGALSQQPPLRMLEILENRLPNARRQLIQGATHMSPITHSDRVNSAIRDFITS